MRKLVQTSNKVCSTPGEAARHSSSTNTSSLKQSTDAGLCESCEQLGRFIEHPWSVPTLPYWVFIKIVERVSPNTCYLFCGQIFAVLASLVAEDKVDPGPFGDSTKRQVCLRPHYIEEHGWRWTFFTLSGEDTSPLLYLLPRHAVFVHKDTREKQHVPFAEIIKPASIREGIVSGWVGVCQQCHDSCKDTSFKHFHPKALIDCERKQLCYNVREPYACLSYVWGGHNEHPNSGGEELLQDLPQTVSDALTVTLELGIRYLWVDRYCIDQNSSDEKHDAIRQMDAIYHGAMITIIAATGNNADHGLPGINRPRDTQFVNIAGNKFITMADQVESVLRSTWNTRGWTFQESLLSRRRLVFTESQTYFQCMEMQCLESLGQLSDPYLKGAFGVFPTNGIGLLPKGLYDRLQEYYPRRLSYAEDTISAFEGIFRAFQTWNNQPPHMRLSHLYGIPFFIDLKDKRRANSTFALHLAWTLRFDDETTISLNDSRQEVVLPTWSWAWSKVHLNDVHNINRLRFDFRPKESSQEIDIQLTHRSGAKLDLNTYFEEGYDYMKLEPWIDITSWTITGEFSRPRHFTGIPETTVQSRLNHVHVGNNLSAVYLGSISYSNVEMVFLVVEPVGEGQYRCVGVCSKRLIQYGLMDLMEGLEGCSNGQPWRQETLRLV
jgi:hypothetical protein